MSLDIEISRNVGFCGGVKIADQAIRKIRSEISDDIYILGKLIHNQTYLDFLESQRIYCVEDQEKLNNQVVLIRTHGVSPKIEKEIRNRARLVYDLTCPKVKKIQNLVESYSKRGYFIVLLGYAGHSETEGLLGYVHSAGKIILISHLEEMKQIRLEEKSILLTQSTFSQAEFEKIEQWITDHHIPIECEDTLCGATKIRQEEMMGLAIEKDVIIVVGGKQSSNTLKMVEEAQKYSKGKVFHIEKPTAVQDLDISKKESIAITSGASTTKEIVDEIYQALFEKLTNQDG